MTLIELREKLRVWLNQSGISEIPQYPIALFSGWHHPDILISLFEEGNSTLFTFQMLEERSLCSGDPLSATPGLVMLVKPYTPELLTRMNGLFSALSDLAGASVGNSFAFHASQEFERILGERGSNCNFSYNGVVCGSLIVLSEVLATQLKQPAALISLDLARFLRCNSAEAVLQPTQWSETRVYDQFFAADAYLADIGSKISTSTLLQQLEKLSGLDDLTAALNGIIRMFLQARGAILCNLKLSAAFVEALKRIVVKQIELNESPRRKEVAHS